MLFDRACRTGGCSQARQVLKNEGARNSSSVHGGTCLADVCDGTMLELEMRGLHVVVWIPFIFNAWRQLTHTANRADIGRTPL